jgi:hypothetical protein
VSNAKRPALAKKQTAKTEANRREALDEGVKLTLDGEEYVLRVGDVTPALAREVRNVTGHSFMRLISMLGEDPDIDVIAEAIWVARRVRGDEVDLDDVIVDYGLIAGEGFDIETAGSSEGEVDGSPEA